MRLCLSSALSLLPSPPSSVAISGWEEEDFLWIFLSPARVVGGGRLEPPAEVRGSNPLPPHSNKAERTPEGTSLPCLLRPPIQR